MLGPVTFSAFYKYTRKIPCKIPRNTIIILFSTCGANLTVVLTPALTTISANASILVVLGNSWVASEICKRLLVVRFEIAALKIIYNINRLSSSIQVLIYFLLILRPHFHVYCHLESFCWRDGSFH